MKYYVLSGRSSQKLKLESKDGESRLYIPFKRINKMKTHLSLQPKLVKKVLP